MSEPKDNKINTLKEEPESESLGYQIELLQKLLGLAAESKQVLTEIEGFYSDKSISDEIKAILEQVTEAETTNKQAKFQQAWAKIDEARKHHSNRIFSDSAELLREDRNRD